MVEAPFRNRGFSAPNRRQALAGALAFAAPTVLGRKARADTGQVVVATWGGDYARLLKENVEQPFLSPAGIVSVQDVGDEPQRVAKVQAQRRLPRGTMDVLCVTPVAAYQLAQMGLLEEIGPSTVPNLAFVNPALGSSTYAPHNYSAQILIYNPSKVQRPPRSFSDLLDPRFSGKVGFPDANFFYAMMGAGLSGSGPNDMDTAKAFMVKLNGNGLKLYPSTDTTGPAFRSGDLEVGVMWLARAYMWQNAGIPVAAAFPQEGAILYHTGLVVPKNAPNKEAAFKYINAVLEPAAQKGFAGRMGYLPAVTNAELTGRVAEQLALPSPAPKLVSPDYAFTARAQAEVAEWWKKTIQRT